MDHLFIPGALQTFPKLCAGDVSIVLYRQSDHIVRNRVVFNCNALSVVLSGKKDIYRGFGRTEVKAGEATLIPEGHSLVAERFSSQEAYSSLVFFFPSYRAVEFLDRHKNYIQDAGINEPDLKFKQTAYMQGYVQSILHLITKNIGVPEALVIHKLEEIFWLLLLHYPALFLSLFGRSGKPVNVSLMKLVEHHLMEHLTLEELAFLAHKSLSSFKREFERSYGISPGKYIRERKLELASDELLKGKGPSELYLDYGYDSLSGFIQAFKKKYGHTPSAYCNASVVN